ncbi:hypothetical protein Pint_21677 [Pistacia integerrima]|uniref:Uncharacterized protein n=1 Tax=Pistacia integerrima TaxID=434235 RepID=A0ACC0XAP6_9ROSI|nr:hypothetical protein Pint_21677 [Pistacia integerrima]
MVETILSAVVEVVKCLAAPMGRQFMYLYKYNTNFSNLQKDVEGMKLAKDKVQRKVDAAERNLQKIEETVEKWQKDVDSIIDEAEKLIQAKENNPRCFKGLCPNWITRYKHSKKALKLKENDISQLLDNIWKDLDLAIVGIPSKDDRGGCKLLLTTRVHDVLDRMGSINNFKMVILNEGEAWSLFQKMAVLALLQNLRYGFM